MTALSPYVLSMATDPSTRDRSLLEYNRRPLLGLNFIAGAVPSNAADATNDITFTAGVCTGQNGYLISIPAYTKRLDATFALGSAAGGWTAGGSAGSPSDTTYHCHAVFSPQRNVGDIAFDTSPTADNALANSVIVGAGMTEYRRIFSFVRAGGVNQAITAIEIGGGGLEVLINSPSAGTAKSWAGGADDTQLTLAFSDIPSGIAVHVICYFTFRDASAAALSGIRFLSPDQSDVATSNAGLADITIGPLGAIDDRRSQRITRRTNTSAQIKFRASGTTVDHVLYGATEGWIDRRIS